MNVGWDVTDQRIWDTSIRCPSTSSNQQKSRLRELRGVHREITLNNRSHGVLKKYKNDGKRNKSTPKEREIVREEDNYRKREKWREENKKITQRREKWRENEGE